MIKRVVHLRIIHYLGKLPSPRLGKVYNSLNKLVRRIKKYMVTVFITTATTCFAIGFSLLTVSFIRDASEPLIAGIILLVGGAVSFEEAIRRSIKEDDDKKTQMQTLINELKNIRKDLNKKKHN